MRKAKIMLTVLVLVFTGSTLLAFKADKFTQQVVYTGVLGSQKCTTPNNYRAITTGTKNFAASTTALTTWCPDERVITLDFD